MEDKLLNTARRLTNRFYNNLGIDTNDPNYDGLYHDVLQELINASVPAETLVMRFGGQEYVLCAAVYYDDGIERVHQPKNIKTGIVVCGRRHHNCLMTFAEFAYDRDHTKVKQGFLTNEDRFITRKEAAQLAYKCGQISKEQKTLFSEDLW